MRFGLIHSSYEARILTSLKYSQSKTNRLSLDLRSSPHQCANDLRSLTHPSTRRVRRSDLEHGNPASAFNPRFVQVLDTTYEEMLTRKT